MTVDMQFREASLPSVPFDMDFSNDGALLACATLSDGALAPVIRVLRTQDGSMVSHFMQLSVEKGRGVAFVGSGRELVFLFEREGGGTQLYRAALDSKDPTQLQRYPMALNNHAIVRDLGARRFAVLGRQVEIWDADANKVLHVLPGASPGEPVHAAFSRDGAHLYAYGTVEGAVVRYEVDTGKEVARWDAPTPFGAQVLVTPDERYLVAAAASHRGMFVYDLASGRRLEPGADSLLKFDLESLWRPWAASQDSRMLVCLKRSLWCLRLPDLENVTPPNKIVEPRIHSWIAGSAWEAPLIAFGTAEDARVRWFSLVSTGTGE